MVNTHQPKLKRTLNLPLLVFYGLGTTIGAGIYVLVGAAAGRAGMYAPIAFILAAIGIAPTAASYAELSTRYPVSAGEAAYVNAGYRTRWISIAVGWLVIISGTVASATIAIGCAGYIRTFINTPQALTIGLVVAAMGLVAVWGILESIVLTAVFTVIEAGGLVMIIYLGFNSDIDVIVRLPEVLPPLSDMFIWLGIANAGLLAVFAFIGFEDMVNVAEETKRPQSTLPWAIFLTLGITTLLYTLVTTIAVLTIPVNELAQSEAPLAHVYQKLSGGSPIIISLIAVFATLNTILIQIIMVSRVIYGMANQNNMPRIFARVNARTQTPLQATFAVAVATLILALALPLERLAELTSQIVLIIWILANGALVLIKWRDDPAPEGAFIVSTWIPVAGFIFGCSIFVISLIG